MKKVYKIGAIVTTILVAGILIFTLTKNDAVKNEVAKPNKPIVSAADAEAKPTNVMDVSKEELKNMIESKKEFVAYYYQPNCQYCKKAAPAINSMSQKHDRSIYRIDLSTPENQSAFQDFNIPGTPVVVAYKDGQEVERIEGAMSAASYDGFFARHESSTK